MENIFFLIQANTQQMLCEKFENLICIIKWAVATYVKVNKIDPICPFSTHRGTYHKLFYFCDFWPDFFTQHSYTVCLSVCWSVCHSFLSVLSVCLYVCLMYSSVGYLVCTVCVNHLSVFQPVPGILYCPSVWMFVCVCLYVLFPFVCKYICTSVFLYLCLSVHMYFFPPAFLPAFLLSCLSACLSARLTACLSSRLPSCLPSCLLAHLPACLLACMNSCRTVSTCKYFKVCLSVCLLGKQGGSRQEGREKHRQTDWQTVVPKSKNIPIYIKDRETDRPADWLPSDRYIGRQAGQQAGRQKDRQTDRHTDWQTDRQTDRKTDFKIFTRTAL